MKKVLLTTLSIVSILSANSAEELFQSKCATCHKVTFENRDALIAPPVNNVMMHVKKVYKDKESAVKFIKEYALNPDATKTVCPSIDIFGVMPSQKGAITDEELEKVATYMYDTFPQAGVKMPQHQGGGMKGRGNPFMRIDSNKDGYISKDEFYNFRAKKEGIDVSKIKYDFFFKRLDKNGDDKLSKDEFIEFMKMMRGR